MRNVLKKMMLLVPLLLAGFAMVCITVAFRNGALDETVLLFCFVIILLCFVIAELLLLSRVFEKKAKAEIEIMKNEMQIVRLHYSELDNKTDEIDKLRHELRNFLSVISPDKEIFNSLNTATKEFDGISQSLIGDNYCDIKLLNLIINKKASEAKQLGIDFKCSVRIPKDIPVAELDLCSCFYNLLDNACRANIEDEGNNLKWIKLNVSILGSFLIIKQTNSVYMRISTDRNGNFLTTRLDTDEHGFGLGVIKDICKKYDGYCDFKLEGNVFCSTVGLNLATN